MTPPKAGEVWFVEDTWRCGTDPYQTATISIYTQLGRDVLHVLGRRSYRGDGGTKSTAFDLLGHYSRYFQHIKLGLPLPEMMSFLKHVSLLQRLGPTKTESWPLLLPGEDHFSSTIPLDPRRSDGEI